MKTHRTSSAAPRGMSMAEVLVTIAVIGILAAIAIPSYTGYLERSRAAIARNLVETLNNAIHRFNEANYEMIVTAVPSGTTDEMAVVRTLQYRNPIYPKPGTPYVRNTWNPVASSSTSDYRIVWAGTLFQLLSPGTAGTGLKVDFEGADFTTAYSFPANFTMAGS